MSEQHPFVDDLPAREPRDYTRVLWAGVVVLVLVMLAVIAFSGQRDPTQSQVRARHILVNFRAGDPADRARALELTADLREDLLNGADFATLARDYSDDPGSAARGGELGFADRGVYEPPFEAYVWRGRVGEISEIIETNFGFHLIEIMERHISDAELYEQQVEEEALRRLEEQKTQERSGGN